MRRFVFIAIMLSMPSCSLLNPITTMFPDVSQRSSITLYWTAVGDDSLKGRAHLYDLRYYILPLSEVNWPRAVRVGNVPLPAESGKPESVTVKGLRKGITYYFGLKVADEGHNWSELSNIAQVKAP